MKRYLVIFLVPLLGLSMNVHAVVWGDFVNDLKDQTSSVIDNVIPISRDESTESAEQPVDNSRSPVEELAKDDISKATTIGDYTGSAVFAILGNQLCKAKIKGCDNAVVNVVVVAAMMELGSTIGSYAGKAIGETAANRRLAYATEYEYLESEISASEKAITTRKDGIDEANKEISIVNARIMELEEKEALTEMEMADAKKIQEDIKGKMDTNNNLIVQYNEKIAYLDHALESSEESAKSKNENIASWQKEYDSLQSKRDALEQQRDAVEQQNAQLSTNQRALDKVMG